MERHEDEAVVTTREVADVFEGAASGIRELGLGDGIARRVIAEGRLVPCYARCSIFNPSCRVVRDASLLRGLVLREAGLSGDEVGSPNGGRDRARHACGVWRGRGRNARWGRRVGYERCRRGGGSRVVLADEEADGDGFGHGRVRKRRGG